jgi:cell wall-associated NlpC family hydrolase
MGRYLLHLLVLGVTGTITLLSGIGSFASLLDSTAWQRPANRTQAVLEPSGLDGAAEGTNGGAPVGVVENSSPPAAIEAEGMAPSETLTARERLAARRGLLAVEIAMGERTDKDASTGPSAGASAADRRRLVAEVDPGERGRAHPTDRSGVRPGDERSASAAAMPYDHEVVAGDTVYGLAGQLGISPNTIVWANDLDDEDTLQVGQRLTILPTDGVLHEVVAGDTLLSVAEAHEADADRIVAANALSDADALAIGQQLVVPDGRPLRPQPLQQAPVQSAATTGPAPSPPAPQAIAPPASTKPGECIVALAAQYLGYRYLWGGHAPDTGFDCSGFVWYVYKQAGIALPLHDLWGQLAAGPRVPRAQLLPGDVVFFENTYQPGLSHDGIYIGGGRFISAATEGKGVRVDRLDDPYWGPRYFGASRPW